VRGIRIGPAEIYRILRHVPEMCESLAVEQIAPDEIGGSRLVLLVVLREGFQLDDELRKRIKHELQARASAAHVPAVILAVPELPMTYSGKRSERSARDALNGLQAVNVQALRNPASLEPLRRFARQPPEARVTRRAPLPVRNVQRWCTLDVAQMTRIWERVLGVTGLRPEDNFFDRGGDSLAALRLLSLVQPHCRFTPTVALLYEAPTVGGLLEALCRGRKEMLIELKRAGPLNLFLIHDGDGETLLYRNFARHLPDAVSVFGIEPRRLPGVPLALSTIEEMARVYIGEIRKQQPQGPYLLGGLCAGGVIAYEMASQLRSAGADVQLLAILDAARPRARKRASRTRQRVGRLEQLLSEVRNAQQSPLSRTSILLKVAFRKALNMVWWEMRSATRQVTVRLRFALLRSLLTYDLPWPLRLPSLSVRDIYDRAESRYHPRQLSDANVLLLRAQSGQGNDTSYRQIYQDEALGWRLSVPDLEIIDAEGGHSSMLQEPFVASLAAVLGQRMVNGGQSLAADVWANRQPELERNADFGFGFEPS
jgi:acetoacetyl-CoA synthetase